MVGALFVDQAVRNLFLPVLLNDFLKGGLIIGKRACLLNVDIFGNEAQDKTLGFLVAAVEINCRQNRFKRIGNDRRALSSAGQLLAFSETEKLSKLQFSGKNVECLFTDKAGAHFGQNAFGKVFIVQEKVSGDNDRQD